MNREAGAGAPIHDLRGKRRQTALTTILAGAMLLAPAAAQALPVRLPVAQEDAGGAAARSRNQVIAQGISRLPRGDNVAWTVRRFEVPGDEGTAVESFPLGFALADGGEIALLDESGDVLSLLGHGEATFLPAGDAGAVASRENDVANLFEIALVSGEDATAGTTAGTVVGGPFAAPDGRNFELELVRETLANGAETVIPAAASGTPVLFLMTGGAAQLTPAGGQPVELAAGQYALLASEVTARGAGADPATFVVASIGESIGVRGAGDDGTREGRANRQRDRNRDRANRGARGGGGGGGGGRASGGGEQAGNADADRAARRAARQAAREARRAEQQANQGGQQGAGTPTPATTPPAATPPAGTPPVDDEQDATPQPTALPGVGTPAPVTPTATATPPADEDEVIQDDTDVEDDDEVDQDDTVVDGDDVVVPTETPAVVPTAVPTTVPPTVPPDDSEVIQDDTEAPAGDDVTQDGAGTGDGTQTEQAVGEQTVPAEGGGDAAAEAPLAPASDATLPVEEVPPPDAPVQAPAEPAPPVEPAPPAEPIIQTPAAPPPVAEVPVEQAPVEQAPAP